MTIFMNVVDSAGLEGQPILDTKPNSQEVPGNSIGSALMNHCTVDRFSLRQCIIFFFYASEFFSMNA